MKQTYPFMLQSLPLCCNVLTSNARIAQLLSARFWGERSGILFPGRSNRHSVANVVVWRGTSSKTDWKDQGRGFILLPPWPPNCLGQMLTMRDFSQHLVSSSKTIRPNISRGARCMGHCEMMWSVVCSLAPHSQFVRGARPHLYMDEQKRPTPERRRLNLTQAAQGRPIHIF